MFVSIIVPVYNSAKTLTGCLESILRQTYDNFEIIIIDDGSLDKSEDIYKSYALVDKRIRYKKISNHGVSYARNLGIKLSSGDYLCFVDSDDIIDDKFCETLIENMKNTGSDLSCCGYIETEKYNQFFKNEKDDIEIFKSQKYIGIFTKYQGFLCNKLYKKNIIIENKIMLNENFSMCEDLLFNFQYLQHCNQVCYTNTILYFYIISNTSLSRSFSTKWFDILHVYNSLYSDLYLFDEDTQDYIILYFLMTIMELKARCFKMKLDYSVILSNYNIDFPIDTLYRRVLASKKISFIEKFKLVIFYRLFFISKYIKIWKLSKR